MVYDLSKKKIIAKLEIESEDILHFQAKPTRAKLTVVSVSDAGVLRRHDLEFDQSLTPEPAEAKELAESVPSLVQTSEVNSMRLVRFSTSKIKMDPMGRFIVLVDTRGQIRIVLMKNFKTVREGQVGFGPVKTRLFKDFVISLSKDRVLAIFDVKHNKKHRTIDLKKYAAIDTQFYEFIILDEQMK